MSAIGSGEDDAALRATLAGFTVAVTATRRSQELGALLERRGARVLYAPVIRLVPLRDESRLVRATRSCIQDPIDVVIVTTGIGFRGWIEVADGWGMADDLLDVLRRSRLFARGPKAKGAVRVEGLRDEESVNAESTSQIVDHLMREDLAGRRIAVQLHGEPIPEIVAALQGTGAEVLQVPVYRWLPNADVEVLERLLDNVISGTVDCVTFTSASAVTSLLEVAEHRDQTEVFLAALRQTLVVAVGSVTAAPLTRLGLPVVVPERARIGALARLVAEELPVRNPVLRVAGHLMQIRGHAAVVDGDLVPLSPGPIAVLRELARRPGTVRTRADLVAVLPGSVTPDEHAVEVAISRLRAGLGGAQIVKTVVKRGYRLELSDGSSTSTSPSSTRTA